VVRPSDENQGPSQLYGHGPWLTWIVHFRSLNATHEPKLDHNRSPRHNLWRFLGIIDRDPGVSKCNRLHVHIFQQGGNVSLLIIMWYMDWPTKVRHTNQGSNYWGCGLRHGLAMLAISKGDQPSS
jgi:hypothetical protein